MFRKLIMPFLAGMLALSSQAEMVRWQLYPEYESIQFVDEDPRLIKVWNDGKVGLFNTRKNEWYTPIEYSDISPFYNNHATLYKNNKLVGFIDRAGKVTTFDKAYTEAYPEVGFTKEGYILLIDDMGLYEFVDTDGKVAFGPYAKAYPFFEGVAVVHDFVNPRKNLTETFINYIFSDNPRRGEFGLFPGVSKNDVQLLTSFHDGKAIAVVKKKVYFVDKNLELTPFTITGPKKPQAVEIRDKDVIMTPQTNDFLLFEPRYGRFTFDKYLRHTRIQLEDQDKGTDYPFKKEPEKVFDSKFSSFREDDNKLGLNYENKQGVMPAQFDRVIARGDVAIVGLNQRYGVLMWDEDNGFTYVLNNNDLIGFKHQVFDTQLTLSMPTFIKCASATLSSKDPSKLKIKVETREDRETVEGNNIKYDCRLFIPDDLNDATRDVNYELVVKYDGLISPLLEMPAKIWYKKLYEININDKDKKFTMSPTAPRTIEFDVVPLSSESIEDLPKIEVSIKPGTPMFDMELKKITETHYAFTLPYPDEDDWFFTILVEEHGCPAQAYKYNVKFTKPKQKNKPYDVEITEER